MDPTDTLELEDITDIPYIPCVLRIVPMTSIVLSLYAVIAVAVVASADTERQMAIEARTSLNGPSTLYYA